MKTDLTKKELAIKLRKRGKSFRDIREKLDIPLSTLSGWLRDIKLSQQQKEQLHRKKLIALAKARLKASQFHRNARLKRIWDIEQDAKKSISKVEIDKTIGELIFAVFYLAEGAKHASKVEIANTNPEILVSLWKLFCYLYSPDRSKLRCYLHLRMDQSEEKLKAYWSRLLNIPKAQFTKTQFDKRTITPSYKNYKGVCTVYYCDTNLQNRILTIGKETLKIINKGT